MKTTYQEFQKALKIVNSYKDELENHFKDISKQYKEINRFVNVTSETNIIDIEHIQVRTLNCLQAGGFLKHKSKVKDFENIRMSELKRIRNFGNKSLEEIKEICFYANVTLLP